MRLLNARTLVLEDFPENTIPPYAILSHTWGEEEVTFKDITGSRSDAAKKKGFVKIQHCCGEALRDKLTHAWVDTCCIDKSSSAELSEAINSMFRWYRDAAVCYAFLEDVQSGAGELMPDREVHQLEQPKIKWFTRGWTLQELLASGNMIFFGDNWAKLGSKDDLADALSRRTGISHEYLYGEPLSSASIAERMSWASQRDTTREEDRAYSLMGIFDVNMPLLYGEGGKKAFLRLQEEIMKVSGDQSIFVWGLRDSKLLGVAEHPAVHLPYSVRPLHMDKWGEGYVGLLAPSPKYFYGSSGIETRYWNKSSPHTLGSRGIEANIPILQDKGILACGIKMCPRENIELPLKMIRGVWYRRQQEPLTTHVGIEWRLWWRLFGAPRITLSIRPWQYTEERRYPWLLRNLPEGMEIGEVRPKRSFSRRRQLVSTSSRLSGSVWTPPNQTGPASTVKIERWVRIKCGESGKDLLLTLTLESCLPPYEETALFDYWVTVIPSGTPPNHLPLLETYSSITKTIRSPADGQTLRLIGRSRWINNRRLLVVDLESGILSLPTYLLCEAENTIRSLIFRHGVHYYTFDELYQLFSHIVGSFVFLYLIPASVDIDTWNLELPVAGLRIPVTAFTVGVLASWAFVFMVKFLPSFVGYCLLGLNIFVVLRILGLNFVDGVDGVDGVDTLFNTHISVGLSIAAVFGTVLAIEPVVGLLGVPGRYAYFTRPDLVRR